MPNAKCTLNLFDNKTGGHVITPEGKNVGVIYFFGAKRLPDIVEALDNGSSRVNENENVYILDKDKSRIGVCSFYNGGISNDLVEALRAA